MGNQKGCAVNFHASVMDEENRIIDGIKYPNESLTGVGQILGVKVGCISPEYMIKFHTGYQLRTVDFQDVAALCEKFGIDYPDEYAHLKTNNPK